MAIKTDATIHLNRGSDIRFDLEFRDDIGSLVPPFS